MNPVAKFILRAVMGAAGGFFLSRFFLRSENLFTWLAVSTLVVFLAYVLEHLRKSR
jgi:hypothetical protein